MLWKIQRLFIYNFFPIFFYFLPLCPTEKRNRELNTCRWVFVPAQIGLYVQMGVNVDGVQTCIFRQKKYLK